MLYAIFIEYPTHLALRKPKEARKSFSFKWNPIGKKRKIDTQIISPIQSIGDKCGKFVSKESHGIFFALKIGTRFHFCSMEGQKCSRVRMINPQSSGDPTMKNRKEDGGVGLL